MSRDSLATLARVIVEVKCRQSAARFWLASGDVDRAERANRWARIYISAGKKLAERVAASE